MEKDFEVVRKRIKTLTIGKDGNREYDDNHFKFFLKNEQGELISHQYDGMLSLGNDHFAVCKLIANTEFLQNYDYYHLINDQRNLGSRQKWGIVRVNRDKKGSIIPKGESLVVTYLYDRISPNALKTATGYYDDGLTYLELDENNKYYGEQLVPCVLNHATPFDSEYDMFAECSVNDVNGYLPRNCLKKDSITGRELLRKEQAFLLHKNLEGEEGYPLDDDTIEAYIHLTGSNPHIEKSHSIGKNKVAKKSFSSQ